MRIAALSLIVLITGCAGRHQATPEEQALGSSVLGSTQALGASHAEGRIALPYGSELLVSPLFGAGCVVGTEEATDSDRLRFSCNHVATEISGDFTRTGDRYTVDLSGKGVFDFSFDADLTSRPGYVDGRIALSIERNLILTSIALRTELVATQLVLDERGCVTSGSLVASLEAEVPGENPDYTIDAVFGPGCGVMMVAD